MNKRMILSSIASLAVVCCLAQAPAGHHRMHRGRHDLAKELNFTDQQKQQLRSIDADFHNKMAALNKNESITVGAMRDQRAALLKERHTAFQDLLTPEQKNKLQDLRVQAEKRHGAMAAARLQKMKSRLNLTDEQTTKIQTINDQFHTQARKFREDSTMSRTEKRDQFTALLKQHKEALSEVLTPDQREKMKELHKDRTGRL